MSQFRHRTGFAAYYCTVVCRHWVLYLPILIVVPMAVAGLLGRGLGVQYLFRDQRSPFDIAFANDSWWWIPMRLIGSAYLETQAYAVCLFGLLWTTTLLLEEKFARLNRTYLPGDLRMRHYVPGAIVLGLIPLSAALLQLGRQVRDNAATSGWMLMYPILGYLSGLMLFYVTTRLAFYIARRMRWPSINVVLGITIFLIVVASFLPVILPAKLLFVVLAIVVVLYTLLMLGSPTRRVISVFSIIAVVVGFNSIRSEKYGFPGLDEYYMKPLDERPTLHSYWNDNRSVTTQVALDRRARSTCNSSDDQLGTGLIDPIVNLQRWYHRVTLPGTQQTSQTGQAAKPKFVVVATSGGAYRASAWTARVIETLLDGDLPGGDLPGLRRNIRLLTGASGGMVGSAYFAVADSKEKTPVEITKQISADITGSLDHVFDWRRPFSIIRNPMASNWDSLSAVARQMVLYDMTGFFLPMARENDRGRELERHWKSLDKTFAALRDDEARGIRPSLVVSPTMAETGLPLIISNLDLDSVYRDKKEAVELFKLLPGTQAKLRVQTAVRMSATFPFISPSVRLPTNPPYRIIDAGYYDNFGIEVAVSYLSEPAIQAWLKNCTSGIMVVQIRAWPQGAGDSPPPKPKQPGRVERMTNTFAWATTPFEGVANARGTTNFFRNRRELCQLQNLYRDATANARKPVGSECQDDTDFLQTIVFEPQTLNENATFTWDLQTHELAEIDAMAKHDSFLLARKSLAKFWRTALQSTPLKDDPQRN